MEPWVVVQLGMKGGGHLARLQGGNDVTVDGGYGLALGRRHLFYIRRAYKGHRYAAAYALDVVLGAEAAQLATVGVAPHTDGHSAQPPLREEDHAGTGAEDGQPVDDGLTDRLVQTELTEQPHLHRTLAAGQDETVLGLSSVGQLPHLEGLDTQPYVGLHARAARTVATRNGQYGCIHSAICVVA